MKDILKNIMIILLFIGLLFIIAYSSINKQIEYNNKVKVCDTTYNKVILDSIEWNIIKRDTIIYNIKTEMKDEIEKSKLVNDSDAIKLFNKLVTE